MQHFISFNLTYWTYVGDKYFLVHSLLEILEKISRFSRWLRPDWGNTTGAATAVLGSKGLRELHHILLIALNIENIVLFNRNTISLVVFVISITSFTDKVFDLYCKLSKYDFFYYCFLHGNTSFA